MIIKFVAARERNLRTIVPSDKYPAGLFSYPDNAEEDELIGVRVRVHTNGECRERDGYVRWILLFREIIVESEGTELLFFEMAICARGECVLLAFVVECCGLIPGWKMLLLLRCGEKWIYLWVDCAERALGGYRVSFMRLNG